MAMHAAPHAMLWGLILAIALAATGTSSPPMRVPFPAARLPVLRLSGGANESEDAGQAIRGLLTAVKFDSLADGMLSVEASRKKQSSDRSYSPRGPSRGSGKAQRNATEVWDEQKRMLEVAARKHRTRLWDEHRRTEHAAHSRSRSAPARPRPAPNTDFAGSGGWQLNASIGQKIWSTPLARPVSSASMPWGNISRSASPGVSWANFSAAAGQKIKSQEWSPSPSLRGGGGEAGDEDDASGPAEEEDDDEEPGEAMLSEGMADSAEVDGGGGGEDDQGEQDASDSDAVMDGEGVEAEGEAGGEGGAWLRQAKEKRVAAVEEGGGQVQAAGVSKHVSAPPLVAALPLLFFFFFITLKTRVE